MAHHYDVSVKLLLQNSKGVVARALFGGRVKTWINVELPKVQNPRVDLLAKAAGGELRHLELETKLSKDTPRRIAEYYLGLHRLLNRHVEMVVLYLGDRPMRVAPAFVTPSMNFQYRLIDIRSFEGEPLLSSADLGDNMLALLTRCDRQKVLQRVEERLSRLPPGEKEDAARIFMIISGLRGLEKEVSQRLTMIDIMENKVLGPAIRRGLRQGMQRGLEKGMQKGEQLGLQRGRVQIVSAILEDRFGPLPASIAAKLETASERQLLTWTKRAATAKTLPSVFKS